MRAKERFIIGDRVTASIEAETLFSHGQARCGVVVGFGRKRSPQTVRVRRDGLKTVESYHEKFWEREEAASLRQKTGVMVVDAESALQAIGAING
jgi:hypothetical protein